MLIIIIIILLWVVVFCVCVCLCLSITALAATYLVRMSKMRHHRVPCRLLKIRIAGISLKILVFTFQFQDDLQVHQVGDNIVAACSCNVSTISLQLTECTLRRVVADGPLAIADLRPDG